MFRVAFSIIIGLLTVAASPAQEKRMTPELLWQLGRLGDATLSQDGKLVAYTVKRYDLAEDSGSLDLFLKNLDTGQQHTLVSDWSSIADVQFGQSPFGERVFFVGKRTTEEEEKSQVWMVNPVDAGSRRMSDFDEGVGSLRVSPTGRHLAFTMDVKLDQTVNDLYEDLPKADARIIDSLMFRHWNAWHDYKYSHLHVAVMDSDGIAGEPVDLMDGVKADCPVPPFGGTEQFAWSSDGTEIAYTSKNVARWAESTDSDIYLVKVDAPSESKNITAGREGYDNDPVYSPDGKYLAFHSMERPGFEADRNRILIYDRQSGDIRESTAGLDQTAHGATWNAGSSDLLFSSEYRGTNQIFRVAVDGGGAKQVSQGRFNWRLIDVFPGGQRALVSRTDMLRPAELAVLSLADGDWEVTTSINDDIYDQLALPKITERWVEATDGKMIHCWVIHPPDFESDKQWPLLTYCQGGPQGQIGQWFSYRWNFHLMAANGYVVLAPNRRGLPGFGRPWNDQISRDWGGQAMQDILSATDELLLEPYIDRRRAAAVGASFGGYTVYWMMGHHADRFRCLIAHCGVFNLESMYGSTEELFFVNWDLGGPYWKSDAVQKDYDRFSPHRFARNWQTPLLVIHGQKDFRVPVTQGIEAFTTAQVQDVPSRFLYFPEEGHWVQKPQNSVLWQRVFYDWLDRYCKE